MKQFILSAILLGVGLAPAVICAQQKDTIFLYNGQILVGEIKRLQLGVITIDDTDLKILNIKDNKIKALKTAREFKIETSRRDIYYGHLMAAQKNGWTDIRLANDRKVTVPISDLTTLVFLEKKFFKRLEGNVTAGFSFAGSSQIGQVNASTSIRYVTSTLQNQLTASMLGSIDSSAFSRENESLELFSYYDLNTEWFLGGLVAYQRNLELSIASRFQEMFGAGWKVVVKRHWRMLALSGLALNQETSTTGEFKGLLLEIPLMLRVNFYEFSHPNLQVSTYQSGFLSLSESGRFRYNGNTSVSWELIHNFSFTLNLYSSYDSKPPSGQGSKVDYGLVIGLSYKF